jgi:hypothetical protein
LKEQYLASQKPQNAKELFNLRHSQLRNVVERIFGVFKGQWKILSGADYPIKTQVDLVLGLTALHNFIRDQGEDNEVSFAPDPFDAFDGFEEEEAVQSNRSNKTAGTIMMEKKRDKMAEDMWNDYQYLHERQRR